MSGMKGGSSALLLPLSLQLDEQRPLLPHPPTPTPNATERQMATWAGKCDLIWKESLQM